MISRTVTNNVVFALLLTMLMAWVGHTSALFTPASQHVTAETAHAHTHEEYETTPTTDNNQLYAGHLHTSFIADHVHEPPHPGAQLILTLLSESLAPGEYPSVVIPTGPVFPIERPPRTWFST